MIIHYSSKTHRFYHNALRTWVLRPSSENKPAKKDPAGPEGRGDLPKRLCIRFVGSKGETKTNNAETGQGKVSAGRDQGVTNSPDSEKRPHPSSFFS